MQSAVPLVIEHEGEKYLSVSGHTVAAKIADLRPEFVIVFGPPASGKTLNKKAIQTHYKCDHVFDDCFDDWQIAKATGRILILSHARDVKEPRGRHSGPRRNITDALFVPVREAALALGDKWVSPQSFANTADRACGASPEING